MRKIANIVIHCSAGHGDLAAVRRWWSTPKPNGLGWKSPGYHFWIDYDGTITEVQPMRLSSNGVLGHNANSIHICYRGGVLRENVRIASDTRTPEQKAAILTCILNVIIELKKTQAVNKIKILGHRDFSPDKNGNGVIEPWERIKECPSFDAIKEYEWVTI